MTHLKIIFKSFFTAIQDNLELLIMANVGWFGLSAPFILLQFYFVYYNKTSILGMILSFMTFLLIPASTAGLFYLVRVILIEPDAGFRDFIFGFKKYFIKSFFLCLVDILILGVLTVNLVFYLKLFPALSGSFKYLILLVLGLIIWFLFFALLSQIYLFPVMVTKEVSITGILKDAFLLGLNNLRLNVVILATLIFMTVLWIISGLGILCFLGSTVAILETVALQELNRQESGR